MASQLTAFNTASKSSPSIFLILIPFLIFSHGSITTAKISVNIGAIINVNSRVGKEQLTAIQIAIQKFNNDLENHELLIHFRNTSGDPLQAAFAAEELINGTQVQAIIGMQSWEEAALVADVGKKAQVPVISFEAAGITRPFKQLRWPFLLEMATNTSEQLNCAAAIVHSYGWRRVIVIYEDDTYSGDSGMLALLYDALQNVGVEIEYRLVLPPFSSLLNPEVVVYEELTRLLKQQSRVFIVLKLSLLLANPFFAGTKQMGLMGKDSVWITTDTVSSLLDAVEPSVISSMQGAIGIKTYYEEQIKSFLDFKAQFRRNFRLEYPEEDNLKPGIQALRAYDCIGTIAQAVNNLRSNTTNSSMILLKGIRSINFTGLSGDIHFHGGELAQSPVFRIINIVGKSYKELGFWSSKFGFSNSLSIEAGAENRVNRSDSMQGLDALVNWPGELKRVPKGWAMHTVDKPMKIGVPGRTSFDKFVKVEWSDTSNKEKYTGFCIKLFEEVVQILEQNYTLSYEFVPYNGSYDDLVEHVINKSYDAVVGDITILANRSRYVEFTQPFAASGLSMLVLLKSDDQKPWMFLMPFTTKMWVVTCAVLLYTMFVIWFMEHQSNPEFRGPWKDQFGTALWFTFSSLFFAHREKIYSNYSKTVVMMWLFVVFVLTSSYTASLTSFLTVPRLAPSVTDIEWIRNTNASVGCDEDSFVKRYLKDVINLQNIKTINRPEQYPEEFSSGNITAAFLELPYQKVFLKEYCNKYTATGPTYSFGGQAFVFPKGSPFTADVSEAILTLLENGKLKDLEDYWLDYSLNCSNVDSTTETASLGLDSFWGLYLISIATSTFCFLIFVIQLWKKNCHQHDTLGGRNTTASVIMTPIWDKIVSFLGYFCIGRTRAPPWRPQPFDHIPDGAGYRRRSSRWDLVSPADHSEDFEASPPAEIESTKNI